MGLVTMSILIWFPQNRFAILLPLLEFRQFVDERSREIDAPARPMSPCQDSQPNWLKINPQSDEIAGCVRDVRRIACSSNSKIVILNAAALLASLCLFTQFP